MPTRSATSAATDAGAPTAPPPAPALDAGTAHGSGTASSTGNLLADAQLLAASPGERVPDGREPGFHLPLPLVLWGTAGIVVASALFTLWTSMRLRRLEKLACESTTAG